MTMTMTMIQLQVYLIQKCSQPIFVLPFLPEADVLRLAVQLETVI